MTRLESFVAAWLARRVLGKSDYATSAAQLMVVIRVMARKEFPDCDDHAINEFLRDSLNKALSADLPRETP